MNPTLTWKGERCTNAPKGVRLRGENVNGYFRFRFHDIISGQRVCGSWQPSWRAMERDAEAHLWQNGVLALPEWTRLSDGFADWRRVGDHDGHVSAYRDCALGVSSHIHAVIGGALYSIDCPDALLDTLQRALIARAIREG